MKPRIVTINLEARTDIPINEIKNILESLVESVQDSFEFELVEKVKVNVIRDTK